MQAELAIYRRNLNEINDGVLELKDATTKLNRAVSAAKFVAGQLKTVDKTTDKVEKGIEASDVALTILGFVSPLKTPVKALKKVLDKAEKPVEKVDEKLDNLTGRDDKSTPGKEGDGEFLEKVETNLGKVGTALGGVLDTLTITDFKLGNAHSAMTNFLPALQAATRGGEAWSGTYTTLNNRIETQLGARNDLYDDLKDFYDSVQAEVDSFLRVMVNIDFEKIFDSFVDLDAITKVFDFLEKPLDIAAGIIAPIKPLLNAVDALVGLIVDPIIDYITDTLKIDDVIDSVADKLLSFLPAVDLLDEFVRLAQRLQDFLADYALDTLGTLEFLGDVEDVFFGGVVGIPDQGPTGWGTDIPGILTGDDGADILDALGGRDIIRAGGGNDIIIAGEGSDLIDGGAGSDLFYFDASFSEYEFSRVPNTDTFIVSHLLPKNGATNTGVDTLLNLQNRDHVVFTDISFTGKELKTAKIGGSVLEGNNQDNLMFLNSSGDNSSGFHIAKGFGGDDRIFGSTEADRLFGGSGNDTFIPGFGSDQVFGGTGSDTYQVLEGVDRRLVVDLLDGSAFGQGADRLSSVENLVISPNEKHQILANGQDNTIFTGDEVDVISGRGGDDLIDSGGENDFIVAGQGADVVKGGGDNDVMISGSKAVKGVSDLYIGGDGRDTVAYTSSSNTIKFDIQDESDDPSILQKLKEYMSDVPNSGPVEIRGNSGRVLRFDESGKLIATDRTREVEQFVGSDKADLLIGGGIVELLHGGGGNDTIRTGGTQNIDGGLGDDKIFAQDVDGGSTALQIQGGGGFDTLDLSGVGDARWFYKIDTGIALQLKAFKTSVVEEDLRNTGNAIFSIKPRGVEKILLGNFDDHAIYKPGGGATTVFFLKDGNDRFDGEDGVADVVAGAGDDIGSFTGGGGIFRGGAGNDFAQFDDLSTGNRAWMGADQDFLKLERFRGEADGGDGYDTIAFDPRFNQRIVVNLAAETAATGDSRIDMTLKNFEEVIGTNFNDILTGSKIGEQLLGRGGSDILDGLGGRDKLYGGSSNDTISGGFGDDLLHGGSGNDTLNGGGGSDTASYAWAVPDAEDGALLAGNFGGVNVSLQTDRATGAAGSDILSSIENVFGSNGNDLLQGNGKNNTLSGEDGNDDLRGAGGKDILVTGAGIDIVSGGSGDDRVVVGIGTKTLAGGSGFDTLDFGTVSGEVTINFGTGTYQATFVDTTPVWLQLDTDGDGRNDSNGTEARQFGGVFMTPTAVQEADPFFANSFDDNSRVLPDEDDPEFELFTIREKNVSVASSGTFQGFEAVIGGTSGARIILTSGVDRFDGRNSNRDVIDLSDSARAITYNFSTGKNNVKLLVGDKITGIEGIVGGKANDELTGDKRANILYGEAGNDFIRGFGGDDKIRGSFGNDRLRGGDDDDTIQGGSGNDIVRGDAGNDLLKGGVGRDMFYGGKGRDTIIGGDDTDTASYESASGGVKVSLRTTDWQNVGGGEGSDKLEAIEDLVGSDHRDTLTGNSRSNTLSGGDSGDVLSGGYADDLLIGGKGGDILNGGNGNDRLLGGVGDDKLFGGAGRDILNGGFGNDLLVGEGGFDTFVFLDGAGQDRIRGFNATSDLEVIDLSDVSRIKNFQDLKNNHMRKSGSDVVIDDNDGLVITLLNTKLSSLDRGDFDF